MVPEIIANESIKLVFKWGANQLKKFGVKLESTEKDIEGALNHHIRSVKNWSSEITFKDSKTAKNIQSVYIELDLLLYPRRIRVSGEEVIGYVSLTELLKTEKNHIAILGQPGAGKTTSMKYVCQSIIYDENFFPDKFRYPILIKLREFNNPIDTSQTAGIIIEYLFNTLGLKINIPENKEVGIVNHLKEKLVCELLEKTNALLIVEGLDELAIKKYKSIVIEEVKRIANQLESAKMIITSRTADYTYSIENIAEYEFCPLNDAQVKQFSLKWLGSDVDSSRFLTDIKRSPFVDTTIRPLTIAHLCAIYERVGKIPEKPKTVYKKIINLLLEEWDEQRSIIRSSKYGSFETDRKFEFLSALAYHLTADSLSTIFDKQMLSNIYRNIHKDFDLELKEVNSVIQEIESHTGLFVQCGYELYEFAHKSLQEYLTAEYIVKLPVIPDYGTLIALLPNEMAIAIAISSNPSAYFTEVIFNRLKKKVALPFVKSFINRLLLEKPDFNNDESIGIAALILYTKYLDAYIIEDRRSQLSLFAIDDLVDSFEAFIKDIFKRNSSTILLQKYSHQSEHDVLDSNGMKIITLQLQAHYRHPKLPRYLLCRESFLTEQ